MQIRGCLGSKMNNSSNITIHRYICSGIVVLRMWEGMTNAGMLLHIRSDVSIQMNIRHTFFFLPEKYDSNILLSTDRDEKMIG